MTSRSSYLSVEGVLKDFDNGLNIDLQTDVLAESNRVAEEAATSRQLPAGSEEQDEMPNQDDVYEDSKTEEVEFEHK